MIVNRVLLDLQFLIQHMIRTYDRDLKATIDTTHNANVGVTLPTKFTDDMDRALCYYDSISLPVFIDQDVLEDEDIVPVAINSPIGTLDVLIKPIQYPTPENGFMYAFRVETISPTIAIHRIYISNNTDTSYSLEWYTYDAIKSGDNPVINVDTKYSTEVGKHIDYLIGLDNFSDQEHPSVLNNMIITFSENEFLNGELHA